jgi:hypothetical protein
MSKIRNREMSGWPVAPREDVAVDDASAVAKRFAPEAQADSEDAPAPKKRKPKLEAVE